MMLILAWKKAYLSNESPIYYNIDAIHNTVHEMVRDEARHGKAFQGLLERYFG